MRRILILGALLLVVFAVVFRQRIFVRDPLGKVERNGSVQDGARVYINYSNDVLVDAAATENFLLVQAPNALPGVPKHLFCFSGLLCWTDADQASVFPEDGVGGMKAATMSAKEVTFLDESGARIRAILR